MPQSERGLLRGQLVYWTFKPSLKFCCKKYWSTWKIPIVYFWKGKGNYKTELTGAVIWVVCCLTTRVYLVRLHISWFVLMDAGSGISDSRSPFLPGASVRNSAHGKGHEEGGLAYAKAWSSLRKPPVPEHLPQNQSLFYALTYTSDFTGGSPP